MDYTITDDSNYISVWHDEIGIHDQSCILASWVEIFEPGYPIRAERHH
jgi:hypothetical protein